MPAINTLEYEMMLLTRHISGLPGRSRRTGGNLDQSAYFLLSLLQAGGPMSIRELAEMTGLDTSTLNRQTAALLKHGHAARIPDPDGALARKYTLTAPGTEALEEERAGSQASLGRVLDTWDSKDVEQFARLLHNFNTSIECRTKRTRPRRPKHAATAHLD